LFLLKITPILVASILGIFAVLVALWELRSARNAQRKATAKETYKEYIKLAFEDVEFAGPKNLIRIC